MSATSAANDAVKDIGTAQSDLFVRLRFRTPALVGTSQFHTVIDIIASDWGTELKAGYRKDGSGNTQWFINAPTGGDITQAATILADTWYDLILRRKTGSGDGIAALYVNESLVINSTNQTQTTNAQYVVVGTVEASTSSTAFIDDVVVSDVVPTFAPSLTLISSGSQRKLLHILDLMYSSPEAEDWLQSVFVLDVFVEGVFV